MSTPLLQQFPQLSGYPASFLKDLLSSPELLEAFLFTLPQVQELAAEVEKLGKENEALASKCNVREAALAPLLTNDQRAIWVFETNYTPCGMLLLSHMLMPRP
jgi:hypothetical protein